ncbi:MAG: J domain-containing protein [Candidatus Thermoplasmatota archaeon]|jgi:curved DNA-binding protein CbpA|nr:J domain-containing protein [Candidatus Thermoplasmatota archaeon]
MLLGKKNFQIKLKSDSTPEHIKKARRIIIKNYHPDRWQSDKDKATFLMQEINVAWDLISKE